MIFAFSYFHLPGNLWDDWSMADLSAYADYIGSKTGKQGKKGERRVSESDPGGKGGAF